MKTTIKISLIAMFTCLTILSSCSDDDDGTIDVILTEAEIPTTIKAYIETHFPANIILRAAKEIEKKLITYEIYLSESIKLEFNSTSDIIDINGKTRLPNSVIPEPILNYVSENYPNHFITDWKLALDHQHVKLNNIIELEFEMNGNFIRIDNN